MSLRRIVNASPLILLSKTGQLDLLRLGSADVVTPDAVIAEIGAKGSTDPTAVAVRQTRWLSVMPNPAIPEPVRASKLDAGESAVLALAHGAANCEVVLDDLAAPLRNAIAHTMFRHTRPRAGGETPGYHPGGSSAGRAATACRPLSG